MSNPLPTRRFGRTELKMPVLSLGGMRFQQSWTDLEEREIGTNSQDNLTATLRRAVRKGLHHVETARHYGTSERQLGWAMPVVNDPHRILQSKVPPRDSPSDFESMLERTFQRLGCDRLDLLAIHGINLPRHLDQTLRPGGCMEVVRRWQNHGRIGHVGFSTHGPTDLIRTAIQTSAFDYVNLHWYYINQTNDPAVAAAREEDMGVFIISPTDKGGHMHSPSDRLLDLCSPLHPIVFNDLFCLRDPRIHTISVGAANPSDLDLHLEAVERLPEAESILPAVLQQLRDAAVQSLGEDWLDSCFVGLPAWHETPGEINLPVLLWLHNLLEAWDLESYAQARYRLLGQGSHWFPGANADALGQDVSEQQLRAVLTGSPWRDRIPGILSRLKCRLQGEARRPLASAES